MVDNIFEIENTFLLAGEDGLFDGVEDHRGGHRRCDPPAQDPARVGIDDEGHVGKPRPRRHVGQVGDPRPIRCRRPKPALDTISRTHRGRVCDGGLAGLASGSTGQTQFGHQPLNGAARHRNPLAVERQPHLAGSVDPVVDGVDPRDLGLEGLVTQLAATGFTVDLVVVGRWGDRHTELGQLCADRLDTPPQTIPADVVTLMIGDEPGD
jgi:hypothetical protein